MIPNHPDKYDAEALFDPAEAVGARGDGLPDLLAPVPDGLAEHLDRGR